MTWRHAVVASGTVGGAGTRVALAAARRALDEDGRIDRVTVVEPGGPLWRALWNEAVGRPDADLWIGFADRLPLRRRRGRTEVFVAQNPHLYRPTPELSAPLRAKLWLLARWARHSLRRADLVVCTSRATADDLRPLVRSGTPIEIRPIPVSTPVTKTDHRDRIEEVVLVGDVYGYKRWDEAVAGVDRFATAVGRRVRVVHVGRVVEPDAGRRLEEAVTAAGGVDFDGRGAVPHAEVFAALAAADVALLTSSAETQGLPLAEALAVGVPVVARALPVFVEQGGDAVAWLPVDGGPAEIADALAELDAPERRLRPTASASATSGWDLLPAPA